MKSSLPRKEDTSKKIELPGNEDHKVVEQELPGQKTEDPDEDSVDRDDKKKKPSDPPEQS